MSTSLKNARHAMSPFDAKAPHCGRACLPSALLVAVALGLPGCGSSPTYTNPGDPSSIVSHSVNIQDILAANAAVLQAMIETGVLSDRPSVAVGPIVNKTRTSFSTNEIRSRVVEQMIASDLAEVFAGEPRRGTDLLMVATIDEKMTFEGRKAQSNYLYTVELRRLDDNRVAFIKTHDVQKNSEKPVLGL